MDLGGATGSWSGVAAWLLTGTLLSLSLAVPAAAADFIDWHPTPPALAEAAAAGDFATAKAVAIEATGECAERPDWSPDTEPLFAMHCAGPFLDLFALAVEQGQSRIAETSARVVYHFLTGEAAPDDPLQVLRAAAEEVGRNEEYLRSVPFYDYWAQRDIAARGDQATREIAALALEHAQSQLYATAAVLFERLLFDRGASAKKADPAWSRAFVRSLIRSQRSDTAIAYLDSGVHGLDPGIEDKLRGWALMQQGRYDKADDSLRRAFGSGLGDRETDLLLGRLLRLQGRLDEAMPILERLVGDDRAVIEDEAAAGALDDEGWYAVNVRLARALGELGLAALAGGDLETARRELSESYNRFTVVGDFYPPDGAEFFAGQGEAELARGNCLGAEGAFARALEIDLIFKGRNYPLVPVREIGYRYCSPRENGEGAIIDREFADAWRSIAATWDEAHPQRVASAGMLGTYYLTASPRPRLAHAFFASAASGAQAIIAEEAGSDTARLRSAARYRPVFIGQVQAAWQLGNPVS
ncbi:MAG: hypothetical protein ABGW84_04945 [Sphingomonadaceae bacterium]